MQCEVDEDPLVLDNKALHQKLEELRKENRSLKTHVAKMEAQGSCEISQVISIRSSIL